MENSNIIYREAKPVEDDEIMRLIDSGACYIDFTNNSTYNAPDGMSITFNSL